MLKTINLVRKHRKILFLRRLKLKQQYVFFLQNLQFITKQWLNFMPQRIERKIWMKNRSNHWWEYVANKDGFDWFENFRMDKATFQYICDKLRSELAPKPSQLRASISVEKKVAIAIYKLSSCAEYRVIGNLFGVSKSSVHFSVYKFCKAIIKTFIKEEIKIPDTDTEMKEIIEGFRQRSGMPQVFGAIDGTHIPITAPSEGYADFINRKGWPSVVLQAVVDSNYRFLDITCQHPGCTHDSTVLKDSHFAQKMEIGISRVVQTINEIEVPPFVIGDPAYPLLPWIMKEYANPTNPQEESFNVYLSRARVVVENTFGRLKGRWRILLKKSDINVDFVPNIVATCCILHNIIEKRKVPYNVSWDEPVQNEQLLNSQPQTRVNNSTSFVAHEIREVLTQHLADHYPLLQRTDRM